jgi:hypothetical protein
MNKILLPLTVIAIIFTSCEKDKPIAAAYLYLTNSKVGYIDNLIADPKYISKESQEDGSD